MTGFEASFNQLTPDFRQIVFLCAKHRQALGAGDFGVEIKFTRDTTHCHQPFRGDFTARRTRDHRVGAVFLDVREEVVVRILQRSMFRLQNVFVPAGGQQRTDGRFTNFTTVTFAVFRQQFFEGFNAFNADQMEQFLTRISKVFTQVVVNFDTLFRQFRVQYLSDQRNTTAAARTGFGFGFQRRNGVAAFVDSSNQVAFGDVEAGADLRAVRQFINTDRRLTATRVRWQDQGIRVFRQLDSVQHQLQQVAVVAGIAHQYRTEQGFVVFADNQAFVDLFAFVEVNVATCARRATVRITNTAYVYAQQFQLGAKVCTFKGVFATKNMVNGDLRHFVAWCYQTKYTVVPACAFTDGVDIRIGSLAGIIYDDTPTRSNVQTTLGCQLIARTDTGREDDKVDFQFAAVGKTHGFTRFDTFLHNLKGVFAGVNAHAHTFDFATQLLAAHLIKLFRHQHRGKFDNVGFNA